MKTKLIGSKEVADSTREFLFEKPAGFTFKAGQSIDLTLINPPESDAEGNTRAYSIVAAPHEPHLAIATRLRSSAFKRTLKMLPINSEVEFEGPFGSFTLHTRAERPAVFLVGGIGITPFYSMIKDAMEKKLPHEIYIFFSNRSEKDAPFFQEISDLAKQNHKLHFIPTMTNMNEEEAQNWKGETGYITGDMIKKYIPDFSQAIFYSAGPAGMVAAMRKVLEGMNVVDDDIRTEEFTGY